MARVSAAIAREFVLRQQERAVLKASRCQGSTRERARGSVRQQKQSVLGRCADAYHLQARTLGLCRDETRAEYIWAEKKRHGKGGKRQASRKPQAASV